MTTHRCASSIRFKGNSTNLLELEEFGAPTTKRHRSRKPFLNRRPCRLVVA